MAALFELGAIRIAPGAGAALAAAGLDPAAFLDRHGRGDWGEASERQREHNAFALRHGHTLTSFYRLPDGTDLLVRTDPDRAETLVLLLAEFARREVDAREGYAAWAATYDRGKNPLIAVEEPRAAALLAGVTVTTALDAATGTGRHALALARRGLAVAAIDQSPEMLAVARRAAGAAGLAIGFARASLDAPLPFATGAFDLVVCALALCHVADLRGAVGEFGRVLRPGGHLLLTDFHPDAVARGWRTDFSHLGATLLLPNMAHTADDYRAAATAAGLAIRATDEARVGDAPAGYLPDGVVREHGDARLCLLVLAGKPRA